MPWGFKLSGLYLNALKHLPLNLTWSMMAVFRLKTNDILNSTGPVQQIVLHWIYQYTYTKMCAHAGTSIHVYCITQSRLSTLICSTTQSREHAVKIVGSSLNV